MHVIIALEFWKLSLKYSAMTLNMMSVVVLEIAI